MRRHPSVGCQREDRIVSLCPDAPEGSRVRSQVIFGLRMASAGAQGMAYAVLR